MDQEKKNYRKTLKDPPFLETLVLEWSVKLSTENGSADAESRDRLETIKT